MAATVCLYVIAAMSGTIHSGHERAAANCSECVMDVEGEKVRAQVVKLRTASLWIARRKAARSLRAHDWRRHPEAVEALAAAVRSDRQCLVRQEAAASLGKMKPCLAEAHEALECAAENDSSLIARHAAKKALKALGKGCVEPCDACGPGPGMGLESEPDLIVEPGFDSFEPEVIPPPPFQGEPPFPALPDVLPETSLEPLTPTSMTVPAASATASPIGAEEGTTSLPPRRVVREPRLHLEDDLPLAAPIRPEDPYERRDRRESTPVIDSEVDSPPKPFWPRRFLAAPRSAATTAKPR